jgi:hypothetical protein
MLVFELDNVLFLKRLLLVGFFARLVEKCHVKDWGTIDFLFAVNNALNTFKEFFVFVSLSQLVMKAVIG